MDQFTAYKLQWLESQWLPAVLFGQRLDYPGGSVSVNGCIRPEDALWRAAHMLFRSSLTRRQINKALSKDQRERLLTIARKKLSLTTG